jgi:hypothetical protein
MITCIHASFYVVDGNATMMNLQTFDYQVFMNVHGVHAVHEHEQGH